MNWNCNQPIIMGIVNLTPDSFSDGMPQASTRDFLTKANKLIKEGCDILDIGGESTRPDATPVSLKEEKKRVLDFLNLFRSEHPDFPISLDTKKYDVAQEAMKYNIAVLNDVSFLSDSRFLHLAKQNKAYYVLMHTRGTPQTMMQLTSYPDGLIETIHKELTAKLLIIEKEEFPKDKLIIDLGFGFAKNPEQCVTLCTTLNHWQCFNLPLLFGVSRKRFIQKYTGENEPFSRDNQSAALAKIAFNNGFQIIRTHNVELTKKVLNVNSPQQGNNL
ncbi:MAG: dihydropteroate synthase [bacterium]|nr:dihydropteroate synthase [bacterium]MBU1917062.1 dihydropteroate synthase [bacterium]